MDTESKHAGDKSPRNNHMKDLLIVGLVYAFCFSAQAQAPKDDTLPLPAGASLPALPAPKSTALSARAPSLHSGDLELIQSRAASGGYVVRVAGEPMAIGQNDAQIGWLDNGELRWLDVA